MADLLNAGPSSARTSGREPDLSSFIRVYDNALAPSLCDEMVARFEKDTLHQTGPGGAQPGSHHVDNVSKWTELDIQELEDWNDILETLLQAITRYAERYAEDCQVWMPPRAKLEHFRIKRYLPNNADQFQPHVDVDCLVHAKRFLVLFWYLTDVAEGGETYFNDLNIGVKPVKGRMLMFPPYWMYPHTAISPRSSAKYILGSY
ncbi:MAG: 2OG-Fe(II) oxygenase, partial [Lysobacterales bacterium]